jgi:hypothetical protein
MRHYDIALLSESASLPFAALAPVAAAISKQTSRDVAPLWHVSGTLTAFPNAAAVPVGFYPVTIQDNIDQPGAAGFHTDANNQPYALIQYESDWSVTASHEVLEMLVDPWGNRLYPGVVAGKRVQILEEICDPPENFSYEIDGVSLSDFALPEYFSAAPRANHSYSFLGNCTAPYQVPDGGYISYIDPVTGDWMQITNFGGLQTTNLGPTSRLLVGHTSLRAAIDAYGRVPHPALGKRKPAGRVTMQGPF